MRPARRRWAASFAAAIATLALLHASPVRRFVANKLEQLASNVVDADVSIGSIDYALWRASLELSRVRLSGESLSGRVEGATAAWSPSGGLVVRLTRPRLRWTPSADTETPSLTTPQPWAPPRLERGGARG